MSITPQGMSIQQVYKLYREGSLWVNRKYQRKLVWTIEEKQFLIDSILKDYPIPLVLLAKRTGQGAEERFEIIDGMQRLNAIACFVENSFPLIDGRYFDIDQLARAKQAADEHEFTPATNDKPRLDKKACANLLDYQLAVTVYPAPSEADINAVFGRINASGKHLSNQERRQAGVMTNFAEHVRKLASELRGDASNEIVDLDDMPSISIDSRRSSQGYGLKAEDIFWCKQGILRIPQLRDSEDEQMLADIAASILLRKPIAFSGELMDKIYEPGSDQQKEIEEALAAYGAENLISQMKSICSVIIEIIETPGDHPHELRKIVAPNAAGNPIKTPFYALFMAFFQLMVQEGMSPVDFRGMLTSISRLTEKLDAGGRYSSETERLKNINLTKGLIQPFFAKKEPSALGHGPGLSQDFENSLRRSAIETPRYEFKQGIHLLDNSRAEDADFVSRLIEHICAIANSCPGGDGFLFIGVANNEKDALRIEQLDGIKPIKVGQHFVVGIDREAKLEETTVEKYVGKIVQCFRNSQLTDPLKTQTLNRIDTVMYRQRSVICVRIPRQQALSFVGDKCFYRDADTTREATGPRIVALQQAFTNTPK